MPYLFKQKLDLAELIETGYDSKIVLVAETEEYLNEIYSNHLKNHNYNVVKCTTVDAVTDAAKTHNPHLLLLSTGFLPDLYRLFYFLGSLRRNFPQLRVLTNGDSLDAEIVKQLMYVGVSCHIERKLTRPQDIVLIAKSILEYK